MREPGRPPARQTGEMNTRTHGPDAGSHDAHDRLLIAAAAAGDLAGPELALAEAVRATCPECQALHAELLALAAATRHLPAPIRPTAMDFRITSERAAELARGGLWRRLLSPFGRPGSGAIRPLAAAFTTLGLAGLMLATLPNLQLGGSSAGGGYLSTVGRAVDSREMTPAEAPTATSESATDVPPRQAVSLAPTDGDTAAGLVTGEPLSSLAQAAPSAYADGNEQTFGTNIKGGGIATATPEAGVPEVAGDRLDFAVTDGSSGPSPLVLASLGLLAVGLGLFLLRRLALRLR
jgi:hypothetical protein